MGENEREMCGRQQKSFGRERAEETTTEESTSTTTTSTTS